MEYKLMGVAHSGMANRYFSVRYMRLISGRANLPNHAFRIKSFLKAIKGNLLEDRRTPFRSIYRSGYIKSGSVTTMLLNRKSVLGMR